MRQLGARLGATLQGGDCIELIGDVGAGKTTMVRGLAVGMGIDETVQSPSFTINKLYEAAKGLRLAHYDFYRLADPGLMKDELNEALHDTATVVVIEWSEVVADTLPEDRLTITFASPAESTRELIVAAHGKRSKTILEKLQ